MRTHRACALALFGATLVAAVVLAGCGGGDDSGSGGEADGVITINWGSEPPSLDPGLATDTTSSNVLGNIMDGLITLEGEELTPTPALAESWDVEGNTVTMIDLNMGKLLDNPEKFKEFNKKQPGSPAEAKEMLKGIDGIKVETAEKLTIKLK